MIAITRTLPGPVAELDIEKNKPKGTYRVKPVAEQLKTDFFNKCYLCELKGSTSLNVEHLSPHRGKDKDLEFGWINLFWSCVHCNGTKGERFHPIIDCTAPGMKVLERLDFIFEPFPVSKVTINGLDDKAETANTVKLLTEIHNGSKAAPIRSMEAANLRDCILDVFNRFVRLVEQYEKAKHPDKKARFSQRIRHALKPDAPYTAIMACFVKHHPRLNAEFSDAINVL
jgi:hypothetical protein